MTNSAKNGSVLPFPPVPSASVAAQTLQHSKMVWRKQPERSTGRCAQHRRHLDGRLGLRLGRDVRRPDPHAHAYAHRESGHQLQLLPHDVDLLADSRCAS